MCADTTDPSDSEQPNAGSNKDASLTQLAYETTVQPGRYDDLIADWDNHIRRLLLPNGAEPLTLELDPGLARHFSRALKVFDRIGRSSQKQDQIPSAQELVESQASCALAFNTHGELIANNDAAISLLGLPENAGIEHLPIDGFTRASLRDALSEVRATGIPLPLVVRDTRDRTLVLMASLVDTNGVVLANAVRGQWSKTTEHLLTQGFAVTASEMALVRGLYDGLTLRQIAEQRSRALGTVRTQLKAVQQKTGAHSQIELMRLVIGLVFASNNAEVEAQDTHESGQGNKLPGQPSDRRKITLSDGRVLIYDDLGPSASTNTAIFLHGMLDSPTLPMPFADQLRSAGTRCLCIHRPGYGESTAYSQEGQLGELFAQDLAELLAVLKLEEVSLIGHLSGGVLACIAAAELGPRIKTVVNINGGVPILSRQQFEVMTPRQRVIALTARYAPKALPLMLRAGIALLDSGGERSFMRGLHRHSPRDHRLTQRADVFAQVAEGYRFAVAQGHLAFQQESVLVTSNWEKYMERVDCPVTYVHGRHDGVVAIGSVRDFAERHANVELVECPDFPQLMLYGYPAEMGEAVIAVLSGKAPDLRRSAS